MYYIKVVLRTSSTICSIFGALTVSRKLGFHYQDAEILDTGYTCIRETYLVFEYFMRNCCRFNTKADSMKPFFGDGSMRQRDTRSEDECVTYHATTTRLHISRVPESFFFFNKGKTEISCRHVREVKSLLQQKMRRIIFIFLGVEFRISLDGQTRCVVRLSFYM